MDTTDNTQQPASPTPSFPKRAIGFVLSCEQFSITDLLDFGEAAERAGFDGLWSSDHFQPWQDNEGHADLAWLTLAAVSQRVSRSVAGTGITCPTYRYNPAIVAQAWGTLSALYPGRLWLGVGTGEAINELASGGGWGDYQERAARLVEAVELIRKLWTGEVVNHDGQYYQTQSAKLYALPAQPIPIFIAAGGPKSARLAGTHGDGLITDPESVTKPQIRGNFEEAARAAGKDPSTMPIVVEHWVVVGNRADAEKGARLWRFSPKATKNYTDDPDPRDIQRRAETEVPLEDVYRNWLISTDPDQHAQAIRDLFDKGITHVFVHSAQDDQHKVIDFFGQQVLPQLRL